MLDAVNAAKFVAVNLSATHGEFLGPPTFDSILEAICRRLGAPRPTKERPETVALLSDCVNALTDKGQSLVLGIDHADNLSDEVIGELAQLEKYLDRAPSDILRVFVGSLTLATRIDSAVRRLGNEQRFSEIRLSPPSAEEVAALLAYEDGCQHGGPMLTAGAIDRICAYAKSNLHWAVPMADAARILAESEGEHEVTAELVRSALHEIWSPEQREDGEPSYPAEQRHAYTGSLPVGRSEVLQGLSDSVSPYLDFHATTDFDAQQTVPHRSVWRLAAAAIAVLIVIGFTAFSLPYKIYSLWSPEPAAVIPESLGPESLPEHVLRELAQRANPTQGISAPLEQRTENTSTGPRDDGADGESASASQEGMLSDGPPRGGKDVAKTKTTLSNAPKRRPDDLKTDHWIQTR